MPHTTLPGSLGYGSSPLIWGFQKTRGEHPRRHAPSVLPDDIGIALGGGGGGGGRASFFYEAGFKD